MALAVGVNGCLLCVTPVMDWQPVWLARWLLYTRTVDISINETLSKKKNLISYYEQYAKQGSLRQKN